MSMYHHAFSLPNRIAYYGAMGISVILIGISSKDGNGAWKAKELHLV